MKKNLLIILVLAVITAGGSLFAQKTADVKKAACAPTLDGTIEAIWNEASENVFDKNFPDHDLAIDGDLETDASGYWKALWDNDYLYMLMVIKDDEVIADREEGVDADDDGFDIVFGLADDAITLITMNYDVSGIAELSGTKGCCGFTDEVVADMSGGCVETEDGFITEIAFSISDLGYAADETFKFGIRFNDDDSAEEGRDGLIAWAIDDIPQWNDPTAWGDVTLLTIEAACAVSSLNKLTTASFKAFPNPAAETLYLSDIIVGSEINIVSATGQKVKSFTASSSQISISVGNLEAGIYFIHTENMAQKIIIE